MTESLLTMMVSKKCSFSILIDSSGSIGKTTFEVTKLCTRGLIKKLPADSFKQIINFSDKATMVSDFKKNINQLETDIEKNLVFLNQETNYCSGLELVKTKIKMLPDESNHVIIIITDGVSSDNPSKIISDLIFMNVEFLAIGVGSVSKANLQKIFPGQHVLIFETYKGLGEIIEKIIPTNNLESLYNYSIRPTFNKIQRSTKSLLLDFIISPASNDTSFEAYSTTISILPNDYYHGCKVIVNEKIDTNNSFTAKIELKVKNNAQIKSLPECIYFEIILRDVSYPGYFHMDFGWLMGDIITEFLMNIMVEGCMGNGKSSILNLLFNLFTSSHVIDNCFLAGKSSNHVTTTIDFVPVSMVISRKPRDDNFLPIYDEILEKIKIVLVDKPGMTEKNHNSFSCYQASQGCYRPGTVLEFLIPDQPHPYFECHSFIFVVSLASCLGEEKEIKMIEEKIFECISIAKIQPILVITFSDNYTPEELKASKDVIDRFPVEKDNIFFITPYINDSTKRNPAKDYAGWALLKKAVEIGKSTVEQKKLKNSIQNFYSNVSTNQQSPTSPTTQMDTIQSQFNSYTPLSLLSPLSTSTSTIQSQSISSTPSYPLSPLTSPSTPSNERGKPSLK